MSEFFGDYFIDAVKDNNMIVVSKLLESNNIYDINPIYDINKAMMIACSYGYNIILLLLIRKGGDINMHNNHLLTLAIMNKNYETISILFDNNIIIKKHMFIISYCLNNINMFRYIHICLATLFYQICEAF
jgi:ankyrin repeat protein